jgi:hypothetical protein
VEKKNNLVTSPGIECLLFGRSARSEVITPTNKDNNITVAMLLQLTAFILHLHKPNKNTEESHVQKLSRLHDIALGSFHRHRTDVIKNAMSCQQSTLLPSVTDSANVACCVLTSLAV